MQKSCFVPKCSHTSANSNKIFITVPFKEEVRRSWCNAVNRKKIPKATSGGIFCCEDHFDLERKSVKRVLFQEPSTSAQISSPESSPKKSKILQSSSSSSVASSISSNVQIEDSSSSNTSEEYFKDTYLQKLSIDRTLLSIIDCFEIERPTNSVHQALTWSSYKKANTVKYLISATPDGIINFVSCGYGGRATDSEIVKDSGYLNVLSENCEVMADRGFKQIDSALAAKSCRLIKYAITFFRKLSLHTLRHPYSVASGVKSSREEVKLGKRIASLRIHIERVIRRLREFEILKAHAYRVKDGIEIRLYSLSPTGSKTIHYHSDFR
ncbi:hypothetical protein NQ315_012258, partial [Exocentrus adspersus]